MSSDGGALGSIAQLVRAPALQAGGHWFESSCSHHRFGPVVQLVRTPACHAGGRRFEPVPGRHLLKGEFCLLGPLGVEIPLCTLGYRKRFAQIAQLVEQWTENPRVAGAIPALGTICGHSSSGRAPPCQGGGSEFEPRCPLQKEAHRNVSLFYRK